MIWFMISCALDTGNKHIAYQQEHGEHVQINIKTGSAVILCEMPLAIFNYIFWSAIKKYSKKYKPRSLELHNHAHHWFYVSGDALRWHHNERDGVSNHQSHDCLLNRLFRRRSKKTSKLRVTGLCEGNSTVTGEFPAQRASKAENASIWWRHHGASKQRG